MTTIHWQDHPNLEEMHYYSLLRDLLSENDEGNMADDNRPVFAEPSTGTTGGFESHPPRFLKKPRHSTGLWDGRNKFS